MVLFRQYGPGTDAEREGAPQAPKDRPHKLANQLLNATMSYARLILRKYGELGPFGFAVDREGNVKRETLDIPRLPRDPSRLWKLLAEHMAQQAQRGHVEAVAMAANVSLPERSKEGYSDAVVVNIEHQDGYAIEVTVPYRIYGGHLRTLIPRRIALGELKVEEREGRLFPVR
jgi:hypothetical protein